MFVAQIMAEAFLGRPFVFFFRVTIGSHEPILAGVVADHELPQGSSASSMLFIIINANRLRLFVVPVQSNRWYCLVVVTQVDLVKGNGT